MHHCVCDDGVHPELARHKACAVGLDVLFVDDVIGEAAGQLRARHHARKTSPLWMADCIALATARREAASLATLDAALARAARAEGVEVIGLPDSTGQRP